MVELDLEQLKNVIGGNVDFMGKSYTADELLALFNQVGEGTAVAFVKQQIAINPNLKTQLIETFEGRENDLPEAIRALLN